MDPYRASGFRSIFGVTIVVVGIGSSSTLLGACAASICARDSTGTLCGSGDRSMDELDRRGDDDGIGGVEKRMPSRD